MKYLFCIANRILVIATAVSFAKVGNPSTLLLCNDLCDQALNELRSELKSSNSIVRVHAAEALLRFNRNEEVKEIFESELAKCENQPNVRICIWRVLVRATNKKTESQKYLANIREAYLEHDSPDQVMAAEALAKLNYEIPANEMAAFRLLAADSAATGVPFRRWLLANSGRDFDIRWLAELLDSPDSDVSCITAYALRNITAKLPPDVVARLVSTAHRRCDSKYRVYLIAAAFVVAPKGEEFDQLKKQLMHYAQSTDSVDRCEVAAALGSRGSKTDLSLLKTLLNDRNEDVRVSAAGAILRINCN